MPTLLAEPERMAKKKHDDRPKKVAVLIKASAEWHDWFSRLAEFNRMPGVVLIDFALTKLAKDVGFPDPPPKR